MTPLRQPDPHTPVLAGLSVCFDLDGTLVDTARDLVAALDHATALEGLPPAPFREARATVGFGSMRLLRDAFARNDRDVGEARLKELQRAFLDYYAANIADHSVLFPGVLETLATLTAQGAELSVCTNKPGWLARPLLEELRLTRWFARIVGGDEAPRAKPDARHVFTAAGHRDGNRIAMIGDSQPDMGAARNAGAFAVLLTYGYTATPQKRLRANARLRTLRDLGSALEAWYDPAGPARRGRR